MNHHLPWGVAVVILAVVGLSAPALATHTVTVCYTPSYGPCGFTNITPAVQSADGGSTILIVDGPAGAAYNEPVRFENLTLQCQGARIVPNSSIYWGTDIIVGIGNDSRVSNCVIDGPAGEFPFGIKSTACSVWGECRNITLVNNTVRNASVDLRGLPHRNVTIRNNTVSDGIFLEALSESSIENNAIQGGIQVLGGNKIRISSNRVSALDVGVEFDCAFECVFQANSIERARIGIVTSGDKQILDNEFPGWGLQWMSAAAVP